MNPKVFLNYAREDKHFVRQIYDYLTANNCEVWMDVGLLPGQDWEHEIEQAIKVAHACIICLSNQSIQKVGYVQVEIKKIRKQYDRYPEGYIFEIPVRLDDCRPPSSLEALTWLDWFDPGERHKLLKSVQEAHFKREKISTPAPKPAWTLATALTLSPIDLSRELNDVQHIANNPNALAIDLIQAATLQLVARSFSYASSLLKRANQLQPLEPHIYFLLALAALEGKRPGRLDVDQAQRALEYARRAVDYATGSPNQGIYYLLLGLIKKDFFERKGFARRSPTADECHAVALAFVKTQAGSRDAHALLTLVPVPDFFL